jgi:electron transfer flavoprotein alpha subunit
VTVLCLVERDGDGIAEASLRAVAVARGLGAAAGEVGAPLAAIVFGEAGHLGLDMLAGHGLGAVYEVSREAVPGYAPLAWARAITGLIGEAGASAVVAAGTDRGAEVMAHVGAITGLPVAANCIAAEHSDGGLVTLIRHRWGGLLLEDAVLEAPVALLTVAAESVAQPVPVAAPAPVEVRAHEPRLADGDLAVRASESAGDAGGVSLATARVVVGGGRGVGGPAGFAPLEELAALLGGVVGVSRVVTSEGWRPHTQQIGQTGTRITPELYMACGISGAIQHMAGCSGARHIVAINSDPGAPMVSQADYAVIGDLHEIVPALIEAIKARPA